MRSSSPMRSKGPALVASAVVAAGTFYLSHTDEVAKFTQKRHHTAAVHASPVALAVAASASPTSLPQADAVKLYYTVPDGHTLKPWKVRLGEAHDIESVAYLAAVKAVAGPADTKKAIRFPAGTSVRSVRVVQDTATVDLTMPASDESEGGVITEIGEFKSLVWTLTDLPGIKRVRVRIGGATVPTLPGGHLELDEPLSRSDF